MMAALISGIFWLDFSVAGRSGDASFILSLKLIHILLEIFGQALNPQQNCPKIVHCLPMMQRFQEAVLPKGFSKLFCLEKKIFLT